MNIILTKQQESMIRDNLSTGIFESEQEAVSAGLNLLAQYEDKLHQQLAESIEEVKRGKSRAFDQTVVNDLKAALQARLNEK